MTLMKKKISFQRTYPIKCGQVLNSLKMACIHPCSQGSYRVKGLKLNFLISAHSLSLEFKSFYRVWTIFKKEEYTSPILTTLPHPYWYSRQWSESER